MKIVNWNQISDAEKDQILLRPVKKNTDLVTQVQVIIDKVRAEGDLALIDLTTTFDKVTLDALPVNTDAFDRAEIMTETLAAIQFAYDRIKNYSCAQIPSKTTVDTQDGIVCERHPRAIQRVGLYVPGGSAPLISTLMMLAIPAQIAGCSNRIVCTPPNADGTINPYLLITAKLCGIETIYTIGGAQAIAAMAYGTETIPKVDKIFGPGNAWVTQAKTLVAQDPQGASIDMPAGPSELMVITDQNANPDFVAADLLSQAEHGPDSQVILISTDAKLTATVQQSLQIQQKKLARKATISQALAHSSCIIVDSITEAITLSNRYVPEHLSLQVADPDRYVAQIQSAGAVFLGPFTPETLGDYVTGSNHVLPTYGCARSSSGLSVSDFMTFISVQKATQQGLNIIGPAAMTLAQTEGLQAHAEAVNCRRQQEIACE